MYLEKFMEILSETTVDSIFMQGNKGSRELVLEALYQSLPLHEVWYMGDEMHKFIDRLALFNRVFPVSIPDRKELREKADYLIYSYYQYTRTLAPFYNSAINYILEHENKDAVFALSEFTSKITKYLCKECVREE